MEDSMLFADDSLNEENGVDENNKNKEMLQKDREVKSVIMNAVSRPGHGEMINEDRLRAYARGVFTAVFDIEIQLKLLCDGYKDAKYIPKPLSYSEATIVQPQQ
jgi:hypothetical protein